MTPTARAALSTLHAATIVAWYQATDPTFLPTDAAHFWGRVHTERQADEGLPQAERDAAEAILDRMGPALPGARVFPPTVLIGGESR